MPKFLEELQFKPLTSVKTPKEGIALYNEGGVLKVLHSNGREQALLTQLNGNIDLSDFATKDYVQELMGDIDFSNLDLSEYAKKTDVKTKTSELINDSGFVNTQTLTTNYAKKSEVPTKTSDLINDAGFLTSHPDLTLYETTTAAGLKLTEAKNYTNTKIAELVGTAPDALNTIHELATAFSSQGDLISALSTTLGTKANISDVYTKTKADETFATPGWVTTAIEDTVKGLTGGDIDLAAYAKKDEIPKKVSDLTQDIPYLTQHQSLAGYATESWVNNKGYITATALNGLASETYVDNKVSALVNGAGAAMDTLQELSDALGNDPNFATTIANQIGNKADKSNTYTKGEVDAAIANIDVSDQLKNYALAEDVYTKEEVDEEIKKTAIGSIDLSTYALKTEIPSKVSQLANDSNFVSQNVLSRYALASDVPSNVSELVNDLGFITTSYLANYATKAELPKVPTNISAFANDSGYLTSVSIQSYNYATQNYVQTQINNLVGNAPEALNTIQELATALEGQDDVILALETTIGSKANANEVYTKTEIDNKLENAGGKVTFRKWEVIV